jgi:hypothetical protein
MSVEVRDDREQSRYEVWTDGQLAGFARYRLDDRSSSRTAAGARSGSFTLCATIRNGPASGTDAQLLADVYNFDRRPGRVHLAL